MNLKTDDSLPDFSAEIGGIFRLFLLLMKPCMQALPASRRRRRRRRREVRSDFFNKRLVPYGTVTVCRSRSRIHGTKLDAEGSLPD